MNVCGLAADPYGDPTVTSYPFLLQARKSSDFSLGIFSNCLLQGSHGALLISEGKFSTSSFITHHLKYDLPGLYTSHLQCGFMHCHKFLSRTLPSSSQFMGSAHKSLPACSPPYLHLRAPLPWLRTNSS